MDREAGGIYQGIVDSAGAGPGHWGLFRTSDCGAGDGDGSGEEYGGVGDVCDAGGPDGQGEGVVWEE